jgi:hypothetical protein
VVQVVRLKTSVRVFRANKRKAEAEAGMEVEEIQRRHHKGKRP